MPGHLVGKAIAGGFGGNLSNLITLSLGTEIIYSFVIIICSLMIYFGTKELYELSSHKGIKYFRQAFLFFAIAYSFRSFIKFILIYFNVGRILEISPRLSGILFGQLTLFFFMYFSSMAIFYLLYSVMEKKLKKPNKGIFFFHAIAFIISFIIISSENSLVYLIANFFLFFIVLFAVYTSKKKKSKNNLHTIYSLLAFFWILNIIDILIPEFFQPFQIFIYIASLSVFLIILYKVLKKAGAN